MLSRKCCQNLNCNLNCEDWCTCLPSNATLSILLFQQYNQFIDGNLQSTKFTTLELNNVKLAKYNDNAGDCYLYNLGGAGNGTFQFEEYYEAKSFPRDSYYINPNCRACKSLWDCTSYSKLTGLQNIQTAGVRIECYDPCNVPLGYGNLDPTNRIVIDLIDQVDIDEENYDECLADFGAGIDYQTSQNFYAEIYGQKQCLVNTTFNKRTLRWFNNYDNQVPQGDSIICAPGTICNGGCKPAYQCGCIPGSFCQPPYVTNFDWWNSYSAEQCKTEICADVHSCWNGFFGNQPATLECLCNFSGDSGTGKQWVESVMQHSVTLTIP